MMEHFFPYWRPWCPPSWHCPISWYLNLFTLVSQHYSPAAPIIPISYWNVKIETAYTWEVIHRRVARAGTSGKQLPGCPWPACFHSWLSLIETKKPRKYLECLSRHGEAFMALGDFGRSWFFSWACVFLSLHSPSSSLSRKVSSGWAQSSLLSFYLMGLGVLSLYYIHNGYVSLTEQSSELTVFVPFVLCLYCNFGKSKGLFLYLSTLEAWKPCSHCAECWGNGAGGWAVEPGTRAKVRWALLRVTSVEQSEKERSK